MNKIYRYFIRCIIILGFNLSYYYVIVPEFKYMGFSTTINVGRIVGVSVLTILLLLWGTAIKSDFLSLVWWCFFYLFFLGESIYYQFSVNNSWQVLFGISIFLFLLPVICSSKKRLLTHKISGDSLQLLFILSVIMFIPIFVTSYKNIDLRNLLFINVYETRALYREINTPLVGYLRAPLARILLPYIIAKSIQEKRKFYTVSSIVMILFIYLAGALKSVFIGLIAVVIFYLFSYRKKESVLIGGMAFLSWGGLIFYYVFNNIFILDSFVRRVFFTPAYLNDNYIRFFKGNFTYLSHSPLGLGLVNNKYGTSLSMFVGENVLGLKGLNANVGLFTEGYISFGVGGILVFSLLILLLIKFLNVIDFDPHYFGMLFVYIYYMNTSFLSILLLTHGLVFFVIFSYFYLSRGDQKDVLKI